uniref:Uncharacterized protein n=1 Tax=Octopus bimaculoides TaxID=37653 RepID=A0A0L8HQM3_OCTBM
MRFYTKSEKREMLQDNQTVRADDTQNQSLIAVIKTSIVTVSLPKTFLIIKDQLFMQTTQNNLLKNFVLFLPCASLFQLENQSFPHVVVVILFLFILPLPFPPPFIVLSLYKIVATVSVVSS